MLPVIYVLNQWWGVREGDSWGSEHNPEGGFALQMFHNRWEREGGQAGEDTSGGGGEWPTSCLHTYWRAKGLGTVCPPIPFVPWGVQEPGAW